MTPIESELYELAGIRSDEDPIVSLYLDARCWDPLQREVVRLFLQDRLQWARAHGPAEHRESFERTLDQVERYVRDLYLQIEDQSARGIAVFACEGIGLWSRFRFSHRLRNELTLGTTPHLLQFARFAYDYQPAVVATVDARGAWIFEMVLDDVVGETRIFHDVHRRHSMGGWSQANYQRHVEQQVERNHEEAVKYVAFLLEREPRSQLILAGTAREVAAFERVLPAWTRERILARFPAPGSRNDREGEIRHHLIGLARDEVFERDRELELEDVHGVVAEALAGGLAELGPEDVVLAVNEGRVHRLLLEDGFEQPGSRCVNCAALSMRAEPECAYCGQEMEEVSLGEALARRVLRGRGQVDVLEPQALLHHYYGVAAVLRNRGSRAEIGAAYEPLAY